MTKKSQWMHRKFVSLQTGSIIFLLIAASPLLFYTYKVVPDVETWETPFFTLKSLYFQSVQAYIWTLMTKAIPIFLLSIWFATCKHWWYHVIAIPLGMFIFQFAGILVLDLPNPDEVEFVVTVPLIIGVLLVLYFIRGNLSKNIEVINLDDDIDKEIEKLERLDDLKAKHPEKEDNY